MEARREACAYAERIGDVEDTGEFKVGGVTELAEVFETYRSLRRERVRDVGFKIDVERGRILLGSYVVG